MDSSQEQRKTELLTAQMNASIELYKHHLELFFKWVALFLTAVGALAVYVFRTDFSLDVSARRYGIPMLIALAASVLAFGCFGMWRWVNELERDLKQIAEQLNINPLPLFGGKVQLLYMLVVMLGFVFVCLMLTILWGVVIKQ